MSTSLAPAGLGSPGANTLEDPVFVVHEGGKLAVEPRYPITSNEDLSRIYTPGVARVCMAIADEPSLTRNLTIKGNTVAVVTDGSAVLGLGNIGPDASLPVMEGKAVLFKRFAGIDAWPIALNTQDVDEIVATVAAIAPVFGGINLEDIAAPRCFEIERRLRERLRIPVFHDDQHGTAVVVLAALGNAAKVVGKELSEMRIVMTGAGAAGAAVAHLLLAAGVTDIVLFDSRGALYAGRDSLDPERTILAGRTNPRRHVGDLSEAMIGADVFIGLSRPGMLTESDVASMAEGSVIFALANPDPEIDPSTAMRHAAVVATGRSDYPNQINNVLAFPGIFRGLLDAGAHVITDGMLIAAAEAIATAVGPHELDAGHVVPSVFAPNLAGRVATAVGEAIRSGGG